ncbi:MAG: (Fe-S)-binding protein [Acidimicrobiales bacterium]
MTASPTTDTAAKRFRPRHIPLIIGFGFAGVTLVSFIAEKLWAEDWQDEYLKDHSVTRRYFFNIPHAVSATFYLVTIISIVYGAITFSNRMRNWERGGPEARKTTKKNVKKRAMRVRAGLYMQTLLRDPAAGIMHSLMYFSFLVLLAVTTIGEINLQAPVSLKFLHGGTYQGFSFVADAAGLAYMVGVVWAILRRYVQRPYRIRIKSKPEHALILVTMASIGLSGFATEMFRIAMQGMPNFEKWSFVGYPLAKIFENSSHLAGLQQAAWVWHIASFITFIVILPSTMLRHIFTSPINMYLSERDRPKGAMKAMPNLTETELESFGASVIEDFTWKQLLDTDSCTMCGRCTSVCPAHATGKPLDPREIVLKTGEVMAATGDPVVTPPLGTVADITIGANSMFERVTPEEVWACTTCKACDEICPVNIEILDKILDMRRYLSLMESNFPTELGGAYRNMENSSNPWGMSQTERADWTKSMEGINVLAGGEPLESEYLYWVGCAGSFDDKNKKVTQAMTKLLQRADISFSVLGPAENCTGDPARRSGNEYIFQMLAMQNIETLDAMGVKKIITQCPHCFNTLANEYPQLGGNYEVVHHSQFLEWLIDTGKLDMTDARLEERIVYHDSCYLGRHNDVYTAPRKVLGSLKGIEIVEAGRNGTKGMCCGAGGARMFMEENTGKNINVERSQELLGTGASRIATACPFCYIMIDDGVKGEGVEDDQIKVADIAMHLLDALDNATSVSAPLAETAIQD